MANYIKNTLFTVIALLFLQFTFAQEGKIEKANQKYDYIDAVDIYLMVV